MTVSKHPGNPGQEDKNKQDMELNNSIDELEYLITDKANPLTRNTGNPEIPVLDEIIEPDSPYYDMEGFTDDQPDPAGTTTDLSSEKVERLIGVMDERITGELDALVNILKDTIKDSILTEIKTQLESDLKNLPPAKPDTENL